MGAVQIELRSGSGGAARRAASTAKLAARELIVLELYRQGELSSGKAAQLLGLARDDFIQHASRQGIQHFQLRGEELRQELDASKKL